MRIIRYCLVIVLSAVAGAAAERAVLMKDLPPVVAGNRARCDTV